MAQDYIKLFYMLNSAERKIFSANKLENANKSWNFAIVSSFNLIAGQILCSAELNMKKVNNLWAQG